MPKPHWRDFNQPRGIDMNGSEFTTSLEHLRLEAERMKRRLEDFEVDALALQGSIFAAVARLIEQLGQVVVLLETGQPQEARRRLLEQIASLEAITQDGSPTVAT
jgi:hypothetical protein